MKRNTRTEQIIIIALMIALEIILSKLVSVNLAFLRIGFGFLPIAIVAILYGPIWAAAAYSIGDIIGGFLFPTGAYFPGFTLSAALTGLVFGLILYKKNITVLRSAAASSIVCLVINLLINTFWLTFILGKGFAVLLASRAIKEIAAIPVMTAIIYLCNKTIIKAYTERR